ncbi:UDP-2,4-diacetamido-2,4,6-trideoxy-beta-L-altropyranose hydrolase [Rubrolithibacter danxiaensis]|uniref:UDP-2,4-diacetamido-2,4, 6-trideoxy-beta-L-altropyranose hydrolase n=1 Tax=Rubrolithibacter danxiaensis TaxID=3390805 RepID=UPI003BF813A6
MKRKIWIRADGNAQIGLGHIIRCIALAQMLKDEFDIYFASKEAPQALHREIEDARFSFRKFDHEKEFFAELSGKEIVVLDHYGLGTAYQKRVKDTGCKLVCIDDLHDKEFYADLIINHAPGVKKINYQTQLYTQFALGVEYALLRPAFLKAAKKKRVIANIGTVLICFGGSDHKNLTTLTLQIALCYASIKKIIVVTGAAYPYEKELKIISEKSAKVKCYHSIDDNKMAALMLRSDLAVVPASGILLEALAVGCKVISGMNVDNQKVFFEEYKTLGLFISAENFSAGNLKVAFNKCFETQKSTLSIIDGESDVRVLKIFRQLNIELEVSLRKVEKADVGITYNWASSNAIRAFSFNQHKINYEEHCNWFLKTLEDGKCFYYIAEFGQKLVGSIRFNIKEQDALISYLVDSDFQNIGLGIILLKKGVAALSNEEKSSFKRIVGIVQPQNIASCKAFEKLGFKREIKENNYQYSILINKDANRKL